MYFKEFFSFEKNSLGVRIILRSRKLACKGFGAQYFIRKLCELQEKIKVAKFCDRL